MQSAKLNPYSIWYQFTATLANENTSSLYRPINKSIIDSFIDMNDLLTDLNRQRENGG